YRNCDLLLIDDIQFLVGREKAKEEFFNTFNELRKKQCQIVLTSDCKPKYLKGFEDRLISRFESGVVADITPPDLETKIAIIKRKSYDNKITLTKAVIEYIATNMGDNIREIEGIMSQILAYSRLIRAEISLEIVKNFVQDKIKEKMDQVSLDSILNIISKELNIKPSDIKSKTRTKGIVDARRIGIYLAKTLTSNSTAQIAKFFGLNDHSAVSHNIKKINELIDNDDEIRLQVEELKNKIQRKKD
ncbi:MAG: chromosomal replication initiator protein DnaA, partial [Campylobacter sp.]|nr:chromosomal replication initiator protein DnaA [Campylobacter sp.]